MIADKAHTEMRDASIDKTLQSIAAFRDSVYRCRMLSGLYIFVGLTGQVDNPACILLHIEGVTFADFDIA